MIRLTDATRLALTKLRTRKLRLLITIFVSGLLFSGLAAASIVARGSFHSVESFGDEGFGKRFIVSGYSQTMFDFMQNESIMSRATALNKDLVARKTAEAKRLGLTFDPVTDPVPVQEISMGGMKNRFLEPSHPAAVQAIREYLATLDSPDIETFKETAKNYDAKGFYLSKGMSMSSGAAFKVLHDGKENFDQEGAKNSFGPPKGIDSFSQMWQASSKELLAPFVLPGQSLAKTAGGEVPVIVPVSAAEELLGMTALPESASSSEQLNRIKEIRSQAGDIRFEICVRNTASSELISRAVGAQQEIEANKNNKEYVKPSLIYGLPEKACDPAPIIRDVRTAAEKKQAANQAEFDRIFGKEDPDQKTFAFRVVGVVPDFQDGPLSTFGGIIQSLVVSSLGTGWYTPFEYIEERPELQALFDTTNDIYASNPTYYAEFASSSGARSFMDEKSCSPNFDAMSVAQADGAPAALDPYADCKKEGKYFELGAYGSNSLALESAKRGFGRIFRYLALGVALIAAVIMMGTVGRMIADSRRETAVFRAIGAKRFDIAQIYVLYTIMLSLLVCLFAIVIGVILASVIHSRFSAEATVEALVAYNAQDLDKTFKLYSFYWPDMLQLIGLALLGGMVSSIFPLLRNLRRNPIRDMRDDT